MNQLMDLSTSWDADSCTVTQKLPNILWGPKIYCCLSTGPHTKPDKSIQYHPSLSLSDPSQINHRLRLDLHSGAFFLVSFSFK
jgi:hypothetical protein